jgi:hypothetical protein
VDGADFFASPTDPGTAMLQTSRQEFAARTLIQAMIDLPAQWRAITGA